jgi:hypothetical protein
MAAYADRIGVDYHCQRHAILRIAPKNSRRSASALKLGYLPILEKTSALDYLDRYDSVAVIDADVWVSPIAPSIFDQCQWAHMNAVFERHLPLNRAYQKKLDSYERNMFGPLDGVGLPFFNGGVMVFHQNIREFIPESAAEFLQREELQRFIDGVGQWRYSTDQVLWNWVAGATGMDVAGLAPRFNWLYGMVEKGWESHGWFHHFLLSSHLTGDDPETMIREGNARPRV